MANERAKRYATALKNGYLVGKSGDRPNLTNEWHWLCRRRNQAYVCALPINRKLCRVELDTVYYIPPARISETGIIRLKSLVESVGLVLDCTSDRKSIHLLDVPYEQVDEVCRNVLEISESCLEDNSGRAVTRKS